MSKPLTLDVLYDPTVRINFDGNLPADYAWLDDGEHYVQRKTDAKGETAEWLKVHALTGEARTLVDSTKLQNQTRCTFNSDASALLFTHENGLFYRALTGTLSDETILLARGVDATVGAEFSPNGKMVSFIRDNDVWVVDIDSHREREMTAGGEERLLNGRLDWVYQEEIYGRGNFKGYWWSPDSESIVYLSLDESEVKQYMVVDHIPLHPEVEVINYPKPGQPNPRASLGVVRVHHGGETRWLDLARYESQDFLIVRVGWTPDSRHVVYQIQDREQRWLDLNFDSQTIIQERSNAWVGVTDQPHWLNDGSFLWLSERTGWKHLYHYASDGKLISAITSGKWEVRSLLGVDQEKGVAYFTGTEHSPIANHTYRIDLDGTGLKRLTTVEGTHRSIFNKKCSSFIDYWSDIQTPTQIRLHDANGVTLRTIDANPVVALNDFSVATPELIQVKTRDGFEMEALMIKPPSFDPSRKYPVLVYTYGGPHAQQVQNAWGGVNYLWHQMMAGMGYVIWICDNRTASGKGIESTWLMYRNPGELELRDIEDGLEWLTGQSYIDRDRIGIWGWSYGGFMASYALTHSKRFKMGIAGAPVTDWRNYDTVYTERIMGTPANNPEGYDRSSPIKAAPNLHGELLLIHGATDDNVHLQNTIQFLYELQKTGKKVELMIYPESRHHVTNPLLLKHLRTLMTDFILKNL
jgi:dipeptidyl-peptidase 4